MENKVTFSNLNASFHSETVVAGYAVSADCEAHGGSVVNYSNGMLGKESPSELIASWGKTDGGSLSCSFNGCTLDEQILILRSLSEFIEKTQSDYAEKSAQFQD